MNIYSSTDLDYITQTLELWYSEITGITLSKLRERSTDEFINIQIFIREKIQNVRNLQNKRNELAASNQKNRLEIIKRTNEIKNFFIEIEGLIEKMIEILARQKKIGDTAKGEVPPGCDHASLARKRKIKKNFEKIFENLKKSEKDVRKLKKKRNDSDDLNEINFGKKNFQQKKK